MGACAFIGMEAEMTGGGGGWVIECAAWRSQKGDRKKGERGGALFKNKEGGRGKRGADE